MAFDSKTPLRAIANLVATLPSMQDVRKGVPTSLNHRVSAYVTLGAQRPFDHAAGLRGREMDYRVVFAYRVQDDEDEAEEVVAELLDQLEEAVNADRTLGGVVDGATLNMLGANEPRYVPVAGQEVREYPVIVTVKQRRPYRT